MAWVTGQEFVESVDDSRTLFTAQEPFVAGTIQVFQGAVTIQPESLLEVDTQRVRFILSSSHQVWTYDAIANTLACAGHGLAADTEIVLWSTVSDGLPSGLSKAVVYYVLAVDANHFQVALSAGGAAVVFTQSASGFLYLAEPDPPLIADGLLHYNCFTLGEEVDGDTVIGFWSLGTFQAQYASGVALATIQDILLDADELIQDYATAASYATALTEVSPYRLFRRVQGELAYRLLANRPNLTKTVKSSEKEYADNVKRMKQTYDGKASPVLELSLEQILSQLIAYKQPDADADSTVSAYLDCWGSGRFFGLEQETNDPLESYYQ